MITIAVDAMGGDHAPRPEVEGAVLAAREFDVRVMLVGQPPAVRHELTKHAHRGLAIELVPASEVIAMKDSPMLAFRKKKDSSVHVAAKLVRAGRADGMVSAGNTGAVMAVARFGLGTLESVDRVALAAPFPTLRGGVSVMLDVGANVDSRVDHLLQFAVMGSVYARIALGIQTPRVGLLSIGHEATKGNELTREAHRLLKAAPLSFIGNVEARDVYSGQADVIVCDGFTGNVALKISEGLVEVVGGLLSDELSSTITMRVGSLLTRRALRHFRRRVDYSEYGGAPLLGVNGVTIVGHGRSSAKAVRNAVAMAYRFAADHFIERVEREIAAAAV